MIRIGALDLSARIQALRNPQRTAAVPPDSDALTASIITWLELSRASRPTDAGDESPESAADASGLTDTLRGMLDAREADIARLRQGSDAAVVRRFLTRFIKVHQTTVDIATEGGVTERDVELLRDLLADALEASGVTPFSPAVGADYRTALGVEDSPKQVENHEPARSFKIAAVVRAGYQIDTAEGPVVLMPSKVRIYQPVEG